MQFHPSDTSTSDLGTNRHKSLVVDTKSYVCSPASADRSTNSGKVCRDTPCHDYDVDHVVDEDDAFADADTLFSPLSDKWRQLN